MSLGIVLVTISIILGYLFIILLVDFLSDPNSMVKLLLFLLSFIIFIIYLYLGIKLVKNGYSGLKEIEGLEKKSKFEQMVNQILDQDLKLIDIKLKQLEYNEKVRLLKEKDKSIPLGTKALEELQFRDIKNVVEQALDSNFYENTYPDIIKTLPKKRRRPE
jgi:hypothetical protein